MFAPPARTSPAVTNWLARIQHFDADQCLITENVENQSLFLLTDGEVIVVSNGTEVARLQGGDSIGEVSYPWPGSARRWPMSVQQPGHCDHCR